MHTQMWRVEKGKPMAMSICDLREQFSLLEKVGPGTGGEGRFPVWDQRLISLSSRGGVEGGEWL